MKLSYEDKIKIYELRQSGQSIKSLSKQFAIAESSVKYMIRLIDRHGINIVQKRKNIYYPPGHKQEMWKGNSFLYKIYKVYLIKRSIAEP